MRASAAMIVLVFTAGTAQAQSLRVAGTAGYVSEWELNGDAILNVVCDLCVKVPSRPSGPGLMERVVLILVARLAGELPAMVACRRRVGKCQGQGIGKIG